MVYIASKLTQPSKASSLLQYFFAVHQSLSVLVRQPQGEDDAMPISLLCLTYPVTGTYMRHDDDVCT